MSLQPKRGQKQKVMRKRTSLWVLPTTILLLYSLHVEFALQTLLLREMEISNEEKITKVNLINYFEIFRIKKSVVFNSAQQMEICRKKKCCYNKNQPKLVDVNPF